MREGCIGVKIKSQYYYSIFNIGAAACYVKTYYAQQLTTLLLPYCNRILFDDVMVQKFLTRLKSLKFANMKGKIANKKVEMKSVYK